MDLNKRHVRDLAPVSRENKRCTSQQTRITVSHRWPSSSDPLIEIEGSDWTITLVWPLTPLKTTHWGQLILNCKTHLRVGEIEVPSLVDGKRRYFARVSDFVSWDSASLVPRHKITHSCKIPPLSIPRGGGGGTWVFRGAHTFVIKIKKYP